ncbi:battenin-like [Liolophura sinensis]|uniref:battenin-like n=1 Tax=Liolophura sinensis TaxID=3198878 RepID=UPI003158D366
MVSGEYSLEIVAHPKATGQFTISEKENASDGEHEVEGRSRKIRNLIAFWLFGLCNNFAYVIMLSAAHDILSEETNTSPSNSTNSSSHSDLSGVEVSNLTGANQTATFLKCNQIGTGAILLADILPTLVVKLSAPLYITRIPYRLKVSVVVFFALGSFLIVAFAEVVWLSIVGVVCASIGAGLGEPTFLGLSTFFHRDVVSTWSSGTGGAGVFGALSYAGITSAGVSPRNTLLIMTVIPVLLALSFLFLLSPPVGGYHANSKDGKGVAESDPDFRPFLTWREKVRLTQPLLKFMIPLMVVYLAEYFINQGLHELLYFKDIWLTTKEQYRWFQVDYQLGVFISRSSVNLLKVNKLWIIPILQVMNVAILQTQVMFRYIPSIWIIFGVILFEGLLGGCAYVNTFYKMSEDIAPEYREYSLSVASVADSCGIAIAGTIAIPVHNTLCKLHIAL